MINKSWWKESVIYQIYPRSFMDTSGDGIGDLKGISSKLDYLKDFGVDILWLSPIFTSPDDDNGYDISNYYEIGEKFGSMADFEELLDLSHQKGLKIVLDLVVNHTSDEHLWFKEARSSIENPYRDYYFWKKEKPNNWVSFFGGDTWQYDQVSGEYYLHLFSKKQPDLNWENPKLRQEVYNLMSFWLDKGVDGFRMDVISMISKPLDFPDINPANFKEAIDKTYTNGPRLHEFLREMNAEVLSKYNMLSMGEGIGVNSKQGLLYTDEERQELQMIYHFDHMALDWGKGGKFDIKKWKLTDFKEIFRTWYNELGDNGWITIFLDNHDFPRMVSRFGNDTAYHNESTKLFATLLLSLRGTPCIYQGSEIGMTNVKFDDLHLYKDIEIKNKIEEWEAEGKDLGDLKAVIHHMARDNARTPMQWNGKFNSGFSSGEPWISVNPNFLTINVEKAKSDINSCWYYYQNLLRIRKIHKTLIYGYYEEFMSTSEAVYIYKRWDEDNTYLILLNFTNEVQKLIGVCYCDKGKLLVSNYSSRHENLLQPWEASIYKLR